MKRMLCIDAHGADLHQVKAAVEEAGYEVLTAATARQALALFADQQVDGVLLDADLPDADGASVGRQMERLKPHVPVLLFRGADSARLALRCMDEYIQNPAPPDLLFARLPRRPRTSI